MSKLALIHFVLTVFCLFAPPFFQTAFFWSGLHGEAYNRAYQHYEMHMAWINVISDCGLVLQPQFLVFSKIIKSGMGAYIVLLLLTTPLWSICFGWIFVKLDNWLNHFPVLGKRVF